MYSSAAAVSKPYYLLFFLLLDIWTMKLPQKYISLSSIIWVLKQKRFLQYNQIYHLSSSYHEDEDKSKQKKRYEQYSSWASLFFCWRRIAFSPLSSAYVALDHRHGKDEIAHNSQDDLEKENAAVSLCSVHPEWKEQRMPRKKWETNSKTKQRSKRKEKLLYKKKGSSRQQPGGIIHRQQTKKKETFKLLWLTTRGVATAFESLLLPLGKVKRISLHLFQPKLSTICFRTVIVDLFAW